MLKIKVRIFKTKYRSFYKTLDPTLFLIISVIGDARQVRRRIRQTIISPGVPDVNSAKVDRPHALQPRHSRHVGHGVPVDADAQSLAIIVVRPLGSVWRNA